MVDLDHSVDRIYMTYRHQSQFIGQDFSSRLHFEVEEYCPSGSGSDTEMEYIDSPLDETDILSYQRRMALYDHDEALVDECLNENDEEDDESWVQCTRDYVLGYNEHLLEQTEQNSGASVFRMLSAKDHLIKDPCGCGRMDYNIAEVRDLIDIYNHLIFDFDTHQLAVERLSDEPPSYRGYDSFLRNCVETLRHSAPQDNPISYYRVNIEKLAKETKGFNHASCNCQFPSMKVNQFSFLDYTYLSHVRLTVAQSTDHVFVLATYGGIAAL